MSAFVDTSALFALADTAEESHIRARECLVQLLDDKAELLTTNYIIVELTALLARRLGHQAVQGFFADFFPLLTVVWVDREVHDRAVARQRRLSLVDCVSFEVMREQALDTAFTFDRDFVQQGFRCVP